MALDKIAFAQRHSKVVAGEGFQLWTLTVDLDRRAGRLTCNNGNGQIVFSNEIEFADFPLDEGRLYFTNNTILLPNETQGGPAGSAGLF